MTWLRRFKETLTRKALTRGRTDNFSIKEELNIIDVQIQVRVQDKANTVENVLLP